jgi:hypothetical protein
VLNKGFEELTASFFREECYPEDGGKLFPETVGNFYQTIKVKFSLDQAMKAQRGSRGIALLFL